MCATQVSGAQTIEALALLALLVLAITTAAPSASGVTAAWAAPVVRPLNLHTVPSIGGNTSPAGFGRFTTSVFARGTALVAAARVTAVIHSIVAVNDQCGRCATVARRLSSCGVRARCVLVRRARALASASSEHGLQSRQRRVAGRRVHLGPHALHKGGGLRRGCCRLMRGSEEVRLPRRKVLEDLLRERFHADSWCCRGGGSGHGSVTGTICPGAGRGRRPVGWSRCVGRAALLEGCARATRGRIRGLGLAREARSSAGESARGRRRRARAPVFAGNYHFDRKNVALLRV